MAMARGVSGAANESDTLGSVYELDSAVVAEQEVPRDLADGGPPLVRVAADRQQQLVLGGRKPGRGGLFSAPKQEATQARPELQQLLVVTILELLTHIVLRYHQDTKSARSRRYAMRVLIVEPVDDVREKLAACFRAGHHTAVVSRNGAEALDWLAENAPPDLVVLDLDPEKLSVLELLSAIRGRARSHLPLLFVSRRPRSSRRFGSLGPVVTPPFEPVSVLAAADEVFLERAVREEFSRRRASTRWPMPWRRQSTQTGA